MGEFEMVGVGGDVEWCGVVGVGCGVDCGVLVEEEVDDFEVVGVGGDKEWGDIVRIGSVDGGGIGVDEGV